MHFQVASRASSPRSRLTGDGSPARSPSQAPRRERSRRFEEEQQEIWPEERIAEEARTLRGAEGVVGPKVYWIALSGIDDKFTVVSVGSCRSEDISEEVARNGVTGV